MKNAGKACNNRLYRHIRTFEKIVKNYFVISHKTDENSRNRRSAAYADGFRIQSAAPREGDAEN